MAGETLHKCFLIFGGRKPGHSKEAHTAQGEQAISRQKGPPPKLIFPESCIISVETRRVAEEVRGAQHQQPDSGNSPPNSRFVPKSKKSHFFEWVHKSRFHLSPWSNPHTLIPLSGVLVAVCGEGYKRVCCYQSSRCTEQGTQQAKPWPPSSFACAPPAMVAHHCGPCHRLAGIRG